MDPFDLTPEQDALPALTSEDEPLELWLETKALIAQLRMNLDSFRTTRKELSDLDVEGFLHAESVLEQRLEFIRWLETRPFSAVYVSLVPISLLALKQEAEEDAPDDGEPFQR